MEVFTQPNTGSADLLKEGITPTNIYYDGVYLPAPISPGLIVRNRFVIVTVMLGSEFRIFVAYRKSPAGSHAAYR